MVAAAGMAGAASAAVVQARFDGVTPSRSMELSRDWDDYGAITAGVNNFTIVGTNETALNGTFQAFCMDLGQGIRGGNSYMFTVTPVENAPIPGGGMGVTKANRLRELWGRHYQPNFSNTQAAAFQISVWEIIFDSGLQIRSGYIRFDGSNSTEDLAQSWLNSLNGNSAYYAPVYALTNSHAQDMLVPTPGAAALLGVGGLLMARRRTRQVL